MLSFVKTVFKLLGIGLFSSGCFLAWSGLAVAAEKSIFCEGVITASKLNVRDAPSEKAPVIGKLKKGSRVEVLGQKGDEGGWLRISHDTVKGFIRNRPEFINLVYVTEKSRDEIQVETIEKQLAATEEAVDSFTEQETEIIEELSRIGQELNSMHKLKLSLTVETAKLGKELAAIYLKQEKVKTAVNSSRQYVNTRLNALYRLKMTGRMELFAMPDSVFTFCRQQDALERILSRDFEILKDHMAAMEQLRLLTRELEKKKNEKFLVDARIKEQVLAMTNEREKRNAILVKIREKKSLGLAAVAWLQEVSKKLDRQIEVLNTGSGSPENSSSFGDLKENLEMPVKGIIISKFGPAKNCDDRAFTFQSGIDIRVERGEPVMSVFKGRILFAQWLKGYGNMIIINHGDNYYTLYAHIEEFFKTKGDWVDTREVIATAGDTGSIKGACLHFEVRHHGKPVDPLKWLRKGA